MVAAQTARRRALEPDSAPVGTGPVIAVSRSFGALGKEVAMALAQRLQVGCYDRSLLEAVALRANADIDLVRSLDEHVKDAGQDWWDAFVNGKLLTREKYQQHLFKVIVGISQTGGIIVGRGANEVLAGRPASRIRIVGSLDQCVARVAARERIDVAAAECRVKAVDRERAKYITQVYGADIDDPTGYDLIVNSDRLTIGSMTDLIVTCHGMIVAPGA